MFTLTHSQTFSQQCPALDHVTSDFNNSFCTLSNDKELKITAIFEKMLNGIKIV